VRPWNRLCLVGLTVAGLSLIGGHASAYEWYQTSKGDPIRWLDADLEFRLSEVEPSDDEVKWFKVQEYYETAFAAWTELPGCKVPSVTIVGTTGSRKITSPDSVDDPPDNIGVFIRTAAAWRALPGTTQTNIARTFITSHPTTGAIVDVDIAINDGGFLFTIDDAATAGVDLISVLTHEVGHFFGLDHSTDEAATMSAGYGARDTDRIGARTLEQDDIDGICALYETVPGPGTPDTGDDSDDGGCVGSQNGQTPLWAAFALLILGIGASVRRRMSPRV
jgi:hypothetical protein